MSKIADVTTADPGDIITYTLEYENTGTGVAAHVWINDTLSNGTTYVSSVPAYTSVSGDTYTWHFTDVKPGTYKITLEVSVDVGVADGAQLINYATMDHTDANSNPYTQQEKYVTVTVTAPILTISKSADVSSADPGDIITYNITYRNSGTGAAGHVWINDTIPAETTYVSSTPGYTSVSARSDAQDRLRVPGSDACASGQHVANRPPGNQRHDGGCARQRVDDLCLSATRAHRQGGAPVG